MKRKLLCILLTMCLILCMTACGNKKSGGSESQDSGQDKASELVNEGGQEAEPAESFDEPGARPADGYNAVEVGGITFQVPTYFEVNDDSGTSKTFYAEVGEQVVMINLSAIDLEVSDDEFLARYDALAEATMEGMRGEDGSNEVVKGQSEEFDTVGGHKAVQVGYTFKYSDGSNTLGADSLLVLINNKDKGCIVLANLMQSEKSQYKYHGAFKKMVREAK